MRSIAVRISLPKSAQHDQAALVAHIRDKFTLEPGASDSPLRVAMNLPDEYKHAVLFNLSVSSIKIEGREVQLRYVAEFSFSTGKKGDDYSVELSQEMDGVVLGGFLELKWRKPTPKARPVAERPA